MTKRAPTPHISKKKIMYRVSPELHSYLRSYDRERPLPVQYADLKRFENSMVVYDKHGKDTLWVSAIYSQSETTELHQGLKEIYSILKTGGDKSVHKHLHIERVDFCTFGNSNPFRVKIVNNYNDVYDYFYIKQADASRVYGLELEHILSPSRINYFVDTYTLIEEHIAGIPGDVFITNYLSNPEFNQKRIAKEFVKFNERCFVRLLGDMRSYNYVFDITPDFEEVQFRIRAIDFDQQSYEGRKNLYLPQFFKENKELVGLVKKHINEEVIKQYQSEERTLISQRIIASRAQLQSLLTAMEHDTIAPAEKVSQLCAELSKHYKVDFGECRSMGDILRASLNIMIGKSAEKLK
ncbi:MAG: hypothetical protein JST76_14910 [Bacteroidetes bacterium]|nr:hypothetical protein [Bacteroidota bacterium]